MCTDPLTINGYELSCRECDQCVATYKNSWVSRCVAEKQTTPHAYAITLTYADVAGKPPLGARVYRYKDVQDMWKRIRSAAKRRWKETIELRYVVVGEKGTKYGRCHYHGVVFSSHPIHELGKITDRDEKEIFAYKRRLNWTIWGHGFVEFQPADRKGMAYVLKYILKSRMTSERSKGHKREGKTEWLASSYLWCSKAPPIGATWLYGKLNDLVSLGICPPALRVRVPGGGDWYVSGKLQMEMCLYLHQANKEYRKERGRDLAGWSTLVQSVADEIEKTDTGELVKRKPWEYLINGEEQEEEIRWTEQECEEQFAKLKDWYEHKRKIAAPITDARATVRNCGHIVPCYKCRNAIGSTAVADLKQEYELRKEQAAQRGIPARGFKRWWLTRLRPSRGCQLRDTPILREHFKRLVRITKAEPRLPYKRSIGKTL